MSFTEHRTSVTPLIPSPVDMWKKARKAWKRSAKRRDIAVLLDKPDWVLKDMGITRGDVIEALAFRGDPSLHLRALAARRQFWSRPVDRF